MQMTSLGSVTAEIEDLLVEKFSAKGRNLNHKLKSVGRRLPKNIRVQAFYLAEAEARCSTAKRAHQYDPDRVHKAYKQCIAHLAAFDHLAAARQRRTAWITGVALNILVLAVLFFAVATYISWAE